MKPQNEILSNSSSEITVEPGVHKLWPTDQIQSAIFFNSFIEIPFLYHEVHSF